ncbi:MAG: SurA N-terminal domain-containing protein, partial [Anaerolineales bacterium]
MAHLAQVKRQVTIIRYTAIAIIALVVGLVGYGILANTVLLPLRTVATVNGERITAGEFQKRVGFTRVQLINQFGQYYQFYQLFGGDPNANPQLTQYLQQLQSQLDPANKETLGQQVLDQMIDERIIAQEAERLGITVTEEEVEERMRQNFGFFPNGTPTAAPTSTPFVTPTLNPTQLALVTITPTPSPFPTFTPEPTSTPDLAATSTPSAPDVTATPFPTATPYTLEGYQTQVAQVIENYKNSQVNIDEAFYRALVRAELLREKVRAAITKDLKPVEEQAWVRHILVGTD